MRAGEIQYGVMGSQRLNANRHKAGQLLKGCRKTPGSSGQAPSTVPGALQASSPSCDVATLLPHSLTGLGGSDELLAAPGLIAVLVTTRPHGF